MRTQGAAIIGLALVTVHLIMNACLWTYNLVQTLTVTRHGPDLTWLVSASAHLAATVILDVALLIVFGCLAWTREKVVCEQPQY